MQMPAIRIWHTTQLTAPRQCLIHTNPRSAACAISSAQDYHPNVWSNSSSGIGSASTPALCNNRSCPASAVRFAVWSNSSSGIASNTATGAASSCPIFISSGGKRAGAIAGQFFDPNEDEFEKAGLTKLPSRLVRPPRVAESPVHFECTYHSTFTVPANRRDTIHRVVIGQVVGIHINDDALTPGGRVDNMKIRPLARLGYHDYTSVTEVFTIPVAIGDEAGKMGEAVPRPPRKSAIG